MGKLSFTQTPRGTALLTDGSLPLKLRGALGLYFYRGKIRLQQFPSFSKHSVQYVIWGTYQHSGWIFRVCFQTI